MCSRRSEWPFDFILDVSNLMGLTPIFLVFKKEIQIFCGWPFSLSGLHFQVNVLPTKIQCKLSREHSERLLWPFVSGLLV